MIDRLKPIFLARATQIAARVIAYVLACWLGYDVTAEDPTVATYAAAVGAVALATLDFVIHSVREKREKDADAPGWWKKLGVLAVLSLPLCHAGCAGLTPPAQSPLERADAINRSLILVLDALSEARSLGYLSDDDARELVPYVDAANSAAREVSRLARAGEQDAAFSPLREALHAFSRSYDELLRARLRADETRAAVGRAVDNEPKP